MQITIRGYRLGLWLVVGWLTIAAILAGCSSTGGGTTAAVPASDSLPHSGSVPLPVTSSNSSSASSSALTQTAGTFTASDSSGNKGSMVISLGTIQAASKISDNVIQACSSDIAQAGSSFDRTLAVPITIELQLTSTLSGTIAVNLAKEYVAVAGGAPDPATNDKLILLAKGYASGPECDTPDGDAQVVWQNAPAGVRQVWHGYILQPDAITPNAPTGGNSDIFRLLLDPTVSLSAGSHADLTYITADSPYEVLCQYPMGGGGGRPLLAIEPSRVLNYGCSPA